MKGKYKRIVNTITQRLEFSNHAIERMIERLNYNPENIKQTNSIKRNIWLKRSTCALQKDTGIVRIIYKWRYYIDKDFKVITYMKPTSKERLSTVNNHKVIHKYIPMLYDDILEYFKLQ